MLRHEKERSGALGKRPFTMIAGAMALFAAVAGSSGCSSGKPTELVSIRELPVVDLEGVVTRSGVAFDTNVTSDGNGSIRIHATEPTTVRLYELTDPDVEDARLIYRARVRTENVEGQAYLEMWCRFPGHGEFFSRALETSLSGTIEWTSQEPPFFLRKGQNPDLVKLNVVVEGKGTIWIDDIEVVRATFRLDPITVAPTSSHDRGEPR